MLNVAQAFIVSLGLFSTLMLANRGVGRGELTVGAFIMFNSYNMQVYQPLGFLGTLWRWIRQNMVDVEQILTLLNQDERIQEIKNPMTPDVRGAEIEFRNVTFTYDSKLPAEEQTDVIANLSFKVEAG